MGTWGPGLYANDLARDLQSTIASVMRLPLKPAELVNLLEETFPQQSSQKDDEEYTSFWLVLADQFHKKGVNNPDLFEKALDIIDTGLDLECPERNEMSALDQRKRAKTLAELRVRLAKPPVKKERKTLGEPQTLLMNEGDAVVYPMFVDDKCVNPNYSEWTFKQTGWGAAYIVRSGHIFEYLAYYYPVVLATRIKLSQKPSVDKLCTSGKWELRRPGTCSKLHFRRMEIEIVGNLALDRRRLSKHFPKMRDGRYQAVNDISIANALEWSLDDPTPTIARLSDILK